MHRRVAVFLLTLLGAGAGSIGLLGAVVFQLQPWRSCPYDDSPAACAMLAEDYDAFLAFTVVLLVGLVLLTAAWIVRLRARDRERPTIS